MNSLSVMTKTAIRKLSREKIVNILKVEGFNCCHLRLYKLVKVGIREKTV